VLVGKKYDGSGERTGGGRPLVEPEISELIVKIARENGSWGYTRIAGALKDLGYKVSDATIARVLKEHGIEPGPT